MSTAPTGSMIIAGRSVDGAGPELDVRAPADGTRLDPSYRGAGEQLVEEAVSAAVAAAGTLRNSDPEIRAVLLERIADGMERRSAAIRDRACRETGLPEARLTGELARTTGQLRSFARSLRAGDWQDVRIDPAQPERTPLPRPDLRRRAVALGPVAVFAASNFPLAFSTAGGDTAAALAAGCPVVLKAHEAHPGTGELVAAAVAEAVRATGLPDGTFSEVLGGPETGQLLAAHPGIAAIAFTGSRQAGMALQRTAWDRPVPIPVFAEMSSVNPAFLLPVALEHRAGDIATGFAASFTGSAGQLCTKPGMVVAESGPGYETFVDAAAAAVRRTPPQTMLSGPILDRFRAGVTLLEQREGVEVVARSAEPATGPTDAGAVLLRVRAGALIADPRLQDEVFGPCSLVVEAGSAAELRTVAEALTGQLTATVHADPGDSVVARELLEILEGRAGRLVYNGWPTGVEVIGSMIHGGPFPATTDARFTSVGETAIRRFLRPVAYQDLPAELLPEVLRTSADDGG